MTYYEFSITLLDAYEIFRGRVQGGHIRRYRQCVTEGGESIAEATTKCWQRLDGLETDI